MSSGDIEVLVIAPVSDEALRLDCRGYQPVRVVDGMAISRPSTMKAGRRGACGATSASVRPRLAHVRSGTGCWRLSGAGHFHAICERGHRVCAGPSTQRRGEQSLARRSMGGVTCSSPLRAATATSARWRSTCWLLFYTLRSAFTAHTTINSGFVAKFHRKAVAEPARRQAGRGR